MRLVGKHTVAESRVSVGKGAKRYIYMGEKTKPRHANSLTQAD